MTRTGNVLCTAVWLLFLAGCGGSSKPAPVADDVKPAANDGGLRIAMIAKASANPVFSSAHQGALDAAKEIGEKQGLVIHVEILTPPSEDGQVQAQRIAQAVNQGAQAVLISCSDAGKVTGAINDAVGRGVQVMTFDSDAPESKRFAYYGVDDIETGQQVMKELAAQLGGKGKIAILAGNQNAPNLQKRAQGVREEAKNFPGIEIVDTYYHEETPQEAAKKVTSVMQAHPDLAGWAMIGGWALLNPSLLGDLNPERIKVVSVDALPAMLPYVERGIAPVLLAQPTYKWGYESVQIIVEKVHHKKEVPALNRMELVRVTKENLGAWAQQLKDWGFTDVPPALLKAP
ncbi:MAG: hypothetical protein AMXMBFR7_51240 [Planctomycetota bacterium]